MGNNINKIFKERSCLTAAELEGYVRNTLKPRERNQVERHLLDCELCSEALEGFVESGTDISLIKMKLNLAHRFVSKNSSQSDGEKKSYGWIWVAAAIVCVALVSRIVWKFNQKQNNELAVVQVKDSVQESVQTLTLSRKASAGSAESTTVVDEPSVIKQDNRAEGKKAESPVEDTKISSVVNDRSINVQEEATAYELTDDLKADERKNESQPGTREMYGNAYVPATADNNATAMNQAASKKKTADVTSRTVAEKALSDSWDEIFKLAESGQYQKALLSVDKLQHEKDELKKKYFEGFYLYKLERYNEAIIQFEKLGMDKSHPHYNDAQFYRAMSLISTGKNKEGKEILTRIVKDKLPHHENAAETLRLLD